MRPCVTPNPRKEYDAPPARNDAAAKVSKNKTYFLALLNFAANIVVAMRVAIL